MATVTRAKRRLGSFLAAVRERDGKTLTDAAAELKTSDSTVSRYESGQMLPVWPTVLALLNLFEVEGEERAEATRLWETARNDPPPVRLPTGTLKTFRRMISAEREADTVRTVELSIIPGLLQTERYARALMEAAHRFHEPQVRMDGIVNTRLARQERLVSAEPLQLHAVVDEAAIRRVVGDPAVMQEQLQHLLDMTERLNVTLQTMPFASGAYGTMSGACAIVGYDDDTSGVYLEYPAGGAWVENEEDVGRFNRMFEDAVQAALNPTDTADLIRQQLRALELHDQGHEVAQE